MATFKGYDIFVHHEKDKKDAPIRGDLDEDKDIILMSEISNRRLYEKRHGVICFGKM